MNNGGSLIIGALIIAAGLYFGLAELGPRYDLVAGDAGILRLDRKTGAILKCKYNSEQDYRLECGPALIRADQSSN